MYKKGDWFNYYGLMFEKLNDDFFGLWVCLNSNYIVETKVNGKSHYELRPESEKPLFKENGDLNRFGFRWTDDQVKNYYNL